MLGGPVPGLHVKIFVITPHFLAVWRKGGAIEILANEPSMTVSRIVHIHTWNSYK